MSAFRDRILISTDYERQIFNIMKDLGFDIAVNGTEHHYPDFVNNLRRSRDQTSLAIRFQPDCVISFALEGGNPESCLIDPKAGKTIEKDAYIQYQKLRQVGNRIILIFKGYNNSWNFFENIILVPAEQTVNKYKHKHPIDIDGWICPRKDNYWLEQQSLNNPQASGTPYREVDPTSLQHFMFFKHYVQSILSTHTLKRT